MSHLIWIYTVLHLVFEFSNCYSLDETFFFVFFLNFADIIFVCFLFFYFGTLMENQGKYHIYPIYSDGLK